MSKTFLADSFDATWDSVVLPWFDANRQRFLTSSDIGVVLVPSLSFAQAVRARLARGRMAFAGIHFWVPSDARRFLGGVFPDLSPAADRETLRIVMAAAAADALAADPELLSARSVEADPGALLQSLDRLADAGWTHAELGDEQLVTIGACFVKRLAAHGLSTVQSRDFEIARRLQAGEFGGRPIGALLVIGFSGAHWSSWPVLESMTRLAKDAQVCLRSPRNDGLGLESTWVGSWEALNGVAEPLICSDLIQDRPTYRYAESLWAPSDLSRKGARSAVDFIVADGIAAEARAAVRQAVCFLQKSAVERVGVLVPGPGALAREIAAGLEQSGVPFWDDLGTPKPGFFEKPAWKALLAFAGTPNCDNFVGLLSAGLIPTALSGVKRSQVESVLRRARTRLFFDDLSLLAEQLAAKPEGTERQVGGCLQSLSKLPDSAAFGVMRAKFVALLASCALESLGERIFGSETGNDSLTDLPVARDSFLAWVTARARTATRAQGEFGRHPYARLVLTSYAQAEGLPWSHVVLAGLNEGSFPPPYSNSAFLGEETIFALNEKVRKLNESSLVMVPGVGVKVAAGKGQILGPVEERWAMQQAFVGVLEETKKRAAALVSVRDENDGGAKLRPGEFFLRLFATDFDRAPTESELRHAAGAYRGIAQPAVAVPAVRHAFDRRRERHAPFDEFMFCFRRDDPHPVRLSASRWESALTYPAEVWCTGALGLSLAQANNELPWNLTIGEWAHLWLASAGGPNGVVILNRAEGHFRRSVDAAAVGTLESVQSLLARAGRELPRWWLAAFEKARLYARQLADSLDAVSPKEWPAFACEISLPKNAGVETAQGRLHVFGRMDLVFFDRSAPTVEALLAMGARCWLHDFKSGKNNPLSSKRLAGGEGVQLALYALGLADAGAADVLLTLLKPGAAAVNQLSLAEVRGHNVMWQHLQRLQATGQFGQLEALRDEFRPGAQFPLATLAVPVDVLLSKWRLTHPELAGAEN